ncbi:MAG TPA: lipopolysaccharide assembly protein LapA domain-containing protein [Methylocella sp.]|nr:lipopolysaccharide assembly protein LapA domain-containing protein [Methylocella sp.]
MKQIIRYFFLIPIALVVLALSVANRHPVTIFLDPFAESAHEATQLSLPLYIVMLLSTLVGILIGSFTTWVEQGRHRRMARRARKEASSLRAEISRLSRPGDKRKAT